MKWHDVPVSLSGNDIGNCPAINLNLVLSRESTPAQRMLAPQSTKPQSQFNAEQSNEMVKCHHSPHDSLSGNNIGRFLAINLNLVLSKKSTPMKDVGTTVDKITIPV